MKRLILCATVTAALCSAQRSNQFLDVERAVQLALDRPSPESSDLARAQKRLQWLEAASHRKIEVTPQMTLLTLANPVSIATGLGAGLLLQKPSASNLTVLDARIDLVAAEIALERRRFELEAETADRYATLQLNETAANQVCQGIASSEDRRSLTQTEVSVGRATRLDVIRHDEEVLNRKADCRRAQQEVQLAAVRLAAVTGTDAAQELRVTEIRLSNTNAMLPLQPVQTLRQLARDFRPDGWLSRKIANLWDQLERAKEGQLKLVLKNNGEFAAQKLLLAEKIRGLESQADALESHIQTRIAELRIRVEGLREELDFAKERLALATEQQKIVAARLTGGLATRAEVASAGDFRQRAEFEVARLQREEVASIGTLAGVCGLRGQPAYVMLRIFDQTVREASLP